MTLLSYIITTVLYCILSNYLPQPNMAINVFVQYNDGFLPDILPLTQAPIFVWFDTIIVYYYYPPYYVQVLHCLLSFKEKSECT